MTSYDPIDPKENREPTKDDIATAKFAIRNVLVEHALLFNNMDSIEYLVEKVYEEIVCGTCSHAFAKLLGNNNVQKDNN